PSVLVREVARDGRLPVVLFCAGGIATPADAALMMALGAEGVFVGSGIFKSEDPATRARAIVEATTHWQDAGRVAEASRGLGTPMVSFETEVELRGRNGGPMRGIFIRAPCIAEHGPGVEILAEVDGHPIAARQGN